MSTVLEVRNADCSLYRRTAPACRREGRDSRAVLARGLPLGLDHLTLVLDETAPGGAIPLHWHTDEELFIVHDGGGAYSVGELTMEAGPGDVVLIASGVAHRFVNDVPETLYHTAVHAKGTFEFEYLE